MSLPSVVTASTAAATNLPLTAPTLSDPVSSSDPDTTVKITSTLDFIDKRELGNVAIFTISSAKPGNGVEQLRDNNLDTYWQSDGAAPHIMNIQFSKKVSVSHICFYCDFTVDESYTAKRICIRSGSTSHDLIDITTIEINEPKGWVSIPLFDMNYSHHHNQDKSSNNDLFIRTHMLQVRVLTMHQNGRDTHIRQLKVLGPRNSLTVMGGSKIDSFKTTSMQQFATLR